MIRSLVAALCALTLATTASAQTYRPGFGFSRPGFQFLGGGAVAGLRPQDVFATSLYTGTGAAQTITNGLDLVGKGGLVWGKGRSSTTNNGLFDTLRGASKLLKSSAISAETSFGPGSQGLSAFNSNGFSLDQDGSDGTVNTSGTTYAAWSFRRAAKFFDVVTYTGDGTSGRQIAHGLGIKPGMVIVKRRDTANNWVVWQRSIASPNVNWWRNYLLLNNTQAAADWGDNSGLSQEPDAANIYVGNSTNVNASGGTYVAYLFAHDPDTTNGVIQCGSANVGDAVTLGWQPQFLIAKSTTTAVDWFTLDTARGWGAGSDKTLSANISTAEGAFDAGAPTATGFTTTANSFAGTGLPYVYCAIRAPV